MRPLLPLPLPLLSAAPAPTAAAPLPAPHSPPALPSLAAAGGGGKGGGGGGGGATKATASSAVPTASGGAAVTALPRLVSSVKEKVAPAFVRMGKTLALGNAGTVVKLKDWNRCFDCGDPACTQRHKCGKFKGKPVLPYTRADLFDIRKAYNEVRAAGAKEEESAPGAGDVSE